MPGKYDEMIYKMLNDEPVTPNEVALKLRITQKTAQKTLMQLALTRSEVRYKSSGRIHLFWKSSLGDAGTGR
jgi:Mn-dependent DtxR family transcriptional regulator